MKDRLPSLDGLRGFAALAVFISHSGFNIAALTKFPLLVGIYNTIAVGPNSVQILFVLCGFFMASLYPNIPNVGEFFRKRYTRIFPIFTAICIYQSVHRLTMTTIAWYTEIAIILAIAIIFNRVWSFLRSHSKTDAYGKVIFWSFIALQIGMLIFNATVTPHLIHANKINLPEYLQELLIFLTNVTITNAFVRNIIPPVE